MKSRPFTYNNGNQIPVTEKFGNLTVGIPTNGYQSTNLQWWNGPDEDLGYVVAKLNVDENGNGLQPTPIEGVFGNVGFNRTKTWLYSEFLDLVNSEFGQNFTNPVDAKVWLESNSKWTSFIDNLQNSFRNRVLTVGGEFESFSCLESQINDLINKDLLDSASFVLTPNGYKENVLFSVTPSPVGTNLLLRSEEFENSYWNKTRCTISANQEIAPNGTLTADYVVEDNTTGLRYVGVIGVPTTIGQTYTFSVFVKKKDRSQIGIQINEGGTIFPTAKFNFDTETFTQTSPLMTSSFQSVGNGWFRLIFTRTPTTGTSTVFGIHPLDASGNFGQTGDGVSRTIIWGAQLEIGTTAGTYIPTTTRQVINETICDFTTTRATTGTRVNSDGLIENVPYNLLSYSQNYSSWTKSNLTITNNSTLSPDGSMTGALVVEGTNSGLKYFISLLYGKVGIVHTASFFIKKNTRNWAYLTFGWDGAGDRAAYFDLENGVIGNIEGGVSPAILDVGNGWYRCSITGIMQNNAPRVSISMATGNGVRTYVGDGVSSIYIWGVQLVEGAEPKDYFPVTNRFNIPRLDYSNGCPSILVEPQSTNQFLQTSNYTSPWLTSTTHQITDDLFLYNSGKNLKVLTNDSINANHLSMCIKQSVGIQQGVNTLSFYVKKTTTHNSITVWGYDTLGSYNINYNVDTLVITRPQTSTRYTNRTATIIPMGNNIFRCTETFTSSTGSTVTIGFSPTTSGSNSMVAGQEISFSCPQLERIGSVTSYIPTTTATVTRNADVISNVNAIDLIGQTEGTIFLDFYYKTSNIDFLIFIYESLSNYLCRARIGSTGVNNFDIAYFATGMVGAGAFTNTVTLIPNTRNKIAVTYNSVTQKTRLFCNGVFIGEKVILTAFPINQNKIDIGISYSSTVKEINNVSLWKTQLTDEEAIQLTTL